MAVLRRSATTIAIAAAALLPIAGAQAAGSTTEQVYYNDATYHIETGGAAIIGADPQLLAHATPMYLIRFPVAPGTTGPITLPSGYQPQSNGLPTPDPYHDHVLVAIPGLGSAGTAGEYKAPLRLVRMQYTWWYAYSPTFAPIRSAAEIAPAEAAGELDVLNPRATDPYMLWTSIVLVRPVIAPSS
jgi:hypothetical protein